MQTCLSRRGVFGASGKASRKAVVVRAEAISVPAPFTKVHIQAVYTRFELGMSLTLTLDKAHRDLIARTQPMDTK